MKKKILTAFKISILLCYFPLQGQNIDTTKYYIPFPLEIPMSVSGTFGELRTNALHAGIDFRTQGKTGFNVHAIDNGYVSRIKIEPGGYGRAVYIDHPNGVTSVYAHMEKLNSPLDSFVKSEQYRLMQFRVDLFPPKNLIQIKKGDIIGFSGNSGSSTGPHLHFEIRDSKNQIPVNYVKKYQFEMIDTELPIIQSIWVYPLGDAAQVNNDNSKPYVFNHKGQANGKISDKILNLWGQIGFGIDVFDPTKSNSNKTGVYSIELYIDSTLIFNQVMDQFAFDEVRYVNSLIDYSEFIKTHNRINRLFVQPNNKLHIYKTAISNGVVSVFDTIVHKVTINASDAFQNTSSVTFFIKGHKILISKGYKPFAKKIVCGSDQIFEEDGCKISFYKNSLYDDLNFEFKKSAPTKGFYSNIYQIHNKYTPIQQAVKIQIKPIHLSDNLKPKALIAGLDKNKIIWCGGYYKNNFVEASIRNFGTYAVIVDTIAPKIIPLKSNGPLSNYSKEQFIGFTITDDLSGIATYNGYIDGSWALFEFDSKNNYLYYEFDPTRINFGSKHKLDLTVTDERGNQNEYHTEFYK